MCEPVRDAIARQEMSFKSRQDVSKGLTKASSKIVFRSGRGWKGGTRVGWMTADKSESGDSDEKRANPVNPGPLIPSHDHA